MMLKPVVGISAAILIGGCSPAPERVSRPTTNAQALRSHPAVGCWRLATPQDFGYPRLVRLDSKYRATASGDTIGQALLDATQSGIGIGSASWVPLGHDSLFLEWNDGLAGAEVTLTGRDTLVGIAEEWTDMSLDPRPTAIVTLTREDCSVATFTHGTWLRHDSLGFTYRE